MLEEKEKNRFNQEKELSSKGGQKETPFKRGNGRDFNAQRGAEIGRQRRKGEKGDELQEYEDDQESDVRGG